MVQSLHRVADINQILKSNYTLCTFHISICLMKSFNLSIGHDRLAPMDPHLSALVNFLGYDDLMIAHGVVFRDSSRWNLGAKMEAFNALLCLMCQQPQCKYGTPHVLKMWSAVVYWRGHLHHSLKV